MFMCLVSLPSYSDLWHLSPSRLGAEVANLEPLSQELENALEESRQQLKDEISKHKETISRIARGHS